MTYLTIPHFELLTEQQAFDLSVKHTLAVGPSINPDTEYCIYGGRGCAAAVFLKPGIAEDLDEEETVSTWGGLADQKLVPNLHRNLINRLQRAHDDAVRSVKNEGNLSLFQQAWLPLVAAAAMHFNLDMDAFAIH